jgi:hypothetical protein
MKIKALERDAICAKNPGIDTKLLSEYQRLIKPLVMNGVVRRPGYSLEHPFADRVSDLVRRQAETESYDVRNRHRVTR